MLSNIEVLTKQLPVDSRLGRRSEAESSDTLFSNIEFYTARFRYLPVRTIILSIKQDLISKRRNPPTAERSEARGSVALKKSFLS